MKCVELEVQNVPEGSPLCVQEFGGVFVDNGQRVIVQEHLAGPLCSVYVGQVKQVGKCEMDKLREGHYQLGAAPEKKSEPKKEEPKKKPTELKDIASDRSMGGVGRKKTRTK